MIRIDCHNFASPSFDLRAQVRVAYEALTRDGYVVLDGLLEPERVRGLQNEFSKAYAAYHEDREARDTLEVGNRRFMLSVGLSGKFADRAVYAHPMVLAVVREVLDAEAILESFGAVLSLSGAERQHVHRDGSVLFNLAISTVLPAHALNFALPLIDMNEEHGTTALWPGSHRWQRHDAEASPEIPIVPTGSGVLWDFRTYHSGTPNRSALHRPMIYATYARRWYKDPGNFQKPGQRRLVLDREFLSRVPEDCRDLFSHLRPMQM